MTDSSQQSASYDPVAALFSTVAGDPIAHAEIFLRIESGAQGAPLLEPKVRMLVHAVLDALQRLIKIDPQAANYDPVEYNDLMGILSLAWFELKTIVVAGAASDGGLLGPIMAARPDLHFELEDALRRGKEFMRLVGFEPPWQSHHRLIAEMTTDEAIIRLGVATANAR